MFVRITIDDGEFDQFACSDEAKQRFHHGF